MTKAKKPEESIKPLTKSRFVQATTCSTKLYYANHKDYPDSRMGDPFLKSLADGGYQVGELAKRMHPTGVDVVSLDSVTAVAETAELMQRDNVIIFEAAIAWNDCLIRVDVLVKQGTSIQFYEVKAKSFDSRAELPFVGKKGGLSSDWKPYLFDVAFQHYVLSGYFPEYDVKPYLRLVDKAAKSSIDGINQVFRIATVNGRREVKVNSNIELPSRADGLLVDVSVSDLVERIRSTEELEGRLFDDYIEWLLLHNRNNQKPVVNPGGKCKSCEFSVSSTSLKTGQKSGFESCWSEEFGWDNKDFNDPNVLEIWNYRGIDKRITDGRLKLDQLTKDDFDVEEPLGESLNSKQRQWLQVRMRSTGDSEFYLAKSELQKEMDSWIYPLHMIDFETTTPALPFTSDRHPYELVVFQFSHHKIHKDGRVEHATQFLNSDVGVFPNFEFLRALKAALSDDKGSVFCYSHHENTCLNTICNQIGNKKNEIPDAEELIEFTNSLTWSPKSANEPRRGERCMVDLLELVKMYYYDPAMRGSNSIKQVLPAIMKNSSWLQARYSQPIYGASGGEFDDVITSLNFKNKQWIIKENGQIKDPYSSLPRLFSELSIEDELRISEIKDVADGGAALTAYAKLQLVEMSDSERAELKDALLRYCELDTLAMVMIVEGWREMLK